MKDCSGVCNSVYFYFKGIDLEQQELIPYSCGSVIGQTMPCRDRAAGFSPDNGLLSFWGGEDAVGLSK